MRKKHAILFLASIGIIAAILYIAGFDEVLSLVLKIKLRYILLLLLIQFIIMMLSAFKWMIILRNFHVSVKNIFSATFVGYLVNNITPIGIAGGETVRAYTIYKTDRIPLHTAFASVVIDLFLEIIPIFFLSGLAIFLVIIEGVPFEIAIVLGITTAVMLTLFAISLKIATEGAFLSRLIRVFISILSKLPILEKHIKKVEARTEVMASRFRDAMEEHLMNSYTIIIGTFTSLITWGFRFIRVYIIFLAFGIKIPLSTILIVETTIVILSFIPVLPGALGIWEGASIGLFILFGISAVTATAVTLVDRILFYVIPSILGAISAFYLGINISRVLKDKD